MAFCALNDKSLTALYKLVYKQQLSSRKPVEIISDVYNTVFDKGKDSDQAITFAGQVPKMMQVAMSSDNEVNKKYIPNASEIAQLRSDFEDFDNVKKYIHDNLVPTAQGFVDVAPQLLNEMPPPETPNSGDFASTLTAPIGSNILTTLIDK